jgi:DNA topoisomerase-3
VTTQRKGLGTPATRAAIIEKLVASGFVARKGKNLCATKDGINLVTVLPEPLTSPMLTAEWEQQLSEIAKGSIRPEGFLQGIQTTMEQLVHTYTTALEDGTKRFTPDREPIGKCPRCGQPVYMGKRNFYCGDRTCGFVLWKDNRFWATKKVSLTQKIVAELLQKGRIHVKGMYSEKKNKLYDADVILEDTGGKYINFKLEFPQKGVASE